MPTRHVYTINDSVGLVVLTFGLVGLLCTLAGFTFTLPAVTLGGLILVGGAITLALLLGPVYTE